jgi:hypothetical protein
MNRTPSEFTQHTMTYGAYAGVGLAIITLIFYLSGHPFSGSISLFNYLIIALGIHISGSRFRDIYNEGVISYGQAFKTGFVTIIYAAIIYAFFVWLLYKFIDPGLLGKFIAYQNQVLSQLNMGSENIEVFKKINQTFITPTFIAFSQLLGKAITGLIFSLILAFFIKKEVNPFTQEPQNDN